MPANRKLALLLLVLILGSVAYLTLGARGSWSFVLEIRGIRLAALIITGTAIAVATVMFQTLSGNRILTPSVMGFDSLFMLLQTSLVFTLGGVGLASLGDQTRFGMEMALMMVGGIALFSSLLGGKRTDLHRMILTGIIFGVLFRSLSSFISRLIDPNEFVVAQASMFARFNAVPEDLVLLAGIITAVTLAVAWRMRHELDIMALGRDAAIGLGVNHRRVLVITLGLITVLVATSTALVGPVTFFGLIVTALAHPLMRSPRHGLILPAAALIACLVLVLGQTLIERVFAWTTTLSVIIEFVGGLLFLFLVLKGRRA